MSGGENDTEFSDVSEEVISRDSVTTPSHGRVSSKRNSRHSSVSSCGSHNSLAEYRQMQCSMSYKNRVHNDNIRETAVTSSLNDFRVSERMNDLQSEDGHHVASSPIRSIRSQSLLNARISESSTTITMPESVMTPVLSDTSMFSSVSQILDMPATSQTTEANVAALQTRRAFQQMVLALEDEDSGDDDDSDSGARQRNRSTGSVNAGVVRLGAQEYKMFQFRLSQLEELTAEQSRKQIATEQTIKQEVQTRTQKAIEIMEKQISMYKQAKELECEREVQRRVLEHLEIPQISRTSSLTNMPRSYSLRSTSSAGTLRESYRIPASIKEEGGSFEKLLHPRRSRKRMEQMKVREEAQKREMEQFREFIRTTEMRLTQVQCVDSGVSAAQLERAKYELEELGEISLPDSVLQSSPSDLIELICILCKNGREQDKQIEEAKRLVTAAIEARKVAEATAREAVELTLILDARLDLEVKKSMQQARKTDLQHARESRETRGINAVLSDGQLSPASAL